MYKSIGIFNHIINYKIYCQPMIKSTILLILIITIKYLKNRIIKFEII